MLRAACSHADSALQGVIRAVPSISQADYSSSSSSGGGGGGGGREGVCLEDMTERGGGLRANAD